jgi:ubiquinone/menaquinone biosynthesis C-methylase UbiE
VHAPIFTKDRKELDITGDFVLRDNFHKNMLKMFESKDFRPKRILDVGCSTGLSTLKLHESFPSAEIIGLDLSPFMVATAIHNINTRASQLSAQSRVTYLFASGEDTGLGPGDADLVTMSLISHELPADVSRFVLTVQYHNFE